MTKPFHETTIYQTDHTTYGGKIYYSDFNTDYRRKDNFHGSPIARRIAMDQKFDMECRKFQELKQNKGESQNA